MARHDLPLSDEELQELDNILLEDIQSDEAMTIDMMDGFMHALAIGPTTVSPAEWLPHIWGSDGPMPDIQSVDQLNHILSLVMRHFNGIIAGLESDPPEVFPFWPFFSADAANEMDENEDGAEVGRSDDADWDTDGQSAAFAHRPDSLDRDFDNDDDLDLDGMDPDDMDEDDSGPEYDDASAWCMGFLEGMQMRWDDWQPLLNTPEGQQWFRPIFLLGSDALDPSDAHLVESIAQRAELSSQVEAVVLAMHAYWLPYRQAMSERETARTLQTKVGRNHPCPCGSGRKFRKCCGAAAELQ